MAIVEIIENNEMQGILLPDEMRFPNGVKRVTVRKLGKDRVLQPVKITWDNFFLDQKTATSDIIVERATQNQTERDSFDD